MSGFEEDVHEWLQGLGFSLDQVEVQGRAIQLCSLGQEPQKGKLVIHEDLWHTRGLIIRGRLKALLGKSSRIHARETRAVKITKPEAKAFLSNNHLHGLAGGKDFVGLELNGELCAMISFGKICPIHREDRVWQSAEIIRYCTKISYHVTGGLSKMISFYLTFRQPEDLMTYVDGEWSDGAGFRRQGFVETDTIPSQEFLVDPNTWKRYVVHEFSSAPADSVKVKNLGSRKLIKVLNK